MRDEWVRRPGLISQLADTTAKLILINAPAGFGKTTLITQWRGVAEQTRPFAWVSLDSGDNDPVRLWSHVISALQRSCSGLGEGGDPWPFRADADHLAGELLPGLVNRLAAAACPVVLVLDDYHVIKNRDCHQQVEFFLHHLPSPAQLVLITRADPPLSLARLRVAGEMAEIRMRDLRFTAGDAAALVQTTAGARLGDSDVAALLERTEGWPAGIYLAALSLRGEPHPSAFIRRFTGNNRFVVDFLTEEVLNRQPLPVQQFLRRTSILDRFTAPLCDAVAGVSGSADVIEYLERANLFLISLDDQRMWYRYHPLFAQMLRSQLARTEPGVEPALHRCASAWYRTSGAIDEAVGHALAAGDLPDVAGLVARHWYEFVSAGRASAVRGWLQAIGDDWIAGDPVTTHCAAWVSALCGDRDSARRWLLAMESGGRGGPLPDGMRSLESSAALLRGTFGFDGLRVMREAAARAVELEDDPRSTWYALAHTVHGFSLYLSGDMTAAAAAFDEAVLCEASMPLVRMLALALASIVASAQGRLSHAAELARAAHEIVDGTRLTGVPQGAFAWTALGVAHLCEGRLEQARDELERAVRMRRPWFGISPWPTVDALLWLAPVLAECGDPARAAGCLAEVRGVLDSFPDGAEALRARLARIEARLSIVSRTARLAEPLTEREVAVLRLLRGTLSLREIGGELSLSANTIKTHTRAIYRKLGASSRAEAVERGRRAGILS